MLLIFLLFAFFPHITLSMEYHLIGFGNIPFVLSIWSSLFVHYTNTNKKKRENLYQQDDTQENQSRGRKWRTLENTHSFHRGKHRKLNIIRAESESLLSKKKQQSFKSRQMAADRTEKFCSDKIQMPRHHVIKSVISFRISWNSFFWQYVIP